MTTIEVQVDSLTENALLRLIEQDSEDISAIASRLLARAVRAARPRTHFRTEAIREANIAYVSDDVLLAESASAERASQFVEEDKL